MPSHHPRQAPTYWLLALTLLIAGVMVYTLFTGRSMTERYAPLADAAMEIKLEATIAHLWFEEIISGDRYVEIEEVFSHLDQAAWYARAMLEGGENQEGKFVPLESPALRQKIAQTLKGLSVFRDIARQRWELRSQSGVGSDIDQRFDMVFADFLASADQVETALQREMADSLDRFRTTQTLLIILIVGLGVFLALTFRRHDRSRSKTLLALQDKEENLRITLDSIGDAVIATDTQGAVTRMNPVAETLTGWQAEDALGKPLGEIFNLVNTLTGKPTSPLADKVLQTGQMIGLDKHSKLIAKDGTEFQIADSAAPIRDSAGTINGVVLVFRDVTEDYAVREALRASKQLQSDLLSNSPAVIYMKDLAGRYLFVNRKFSQLFNISTQEIEGKTDHDLFSEESANRFLANDQEVATAGTIIEFEEIVPREDGEHTYLSVKFPLREASGEIYAVCGISTDITERKGFEEELSQLRNYLANIIDSMPSILIGVDNAGKVTQWNSQAEKLLGLAATGTVGVDLCTLVPRLADEMPRVKKAVETRQQQTDLKRTLQLNGETCYEDLTIYPLIANGVEGAVIRIDDVTERVRVEEMMIQSEKMLSIGGLAAGMAHEINNPLAGMMQAVSVMNNRLCRDLPGNLEAAQAAGVSFEAIQAYMENRDIPQMMSALNESGHRVAEIVSNMLSFARKSDQASSSHDLAELIDKTLQLAATDYDLKKQYDFRNIRIDRNYTDELPLVPCEGAKIQQVLLNILRNGAQAMQEAGTAEPRFSIRTAFEKATGMVRVEIEDNGPGIDAETSKRIFEPFYTTKSMGMGTGLGLSVSYFIITENHAGELSVESMPGEGAKFIIRLPASSLN